MRILYFLTIQIALMFSVFAQESTFTPPENFIRNQDAVAETYINTGAAATIQISKLENVDLNSFYENFNKDQFFENGLEIITENANIIDDVVQSFYYTCKYVIQQEHEGQISEFMRIIYFTENNGTLIMAVASFPLISVDLLQKPIIESFNNMIEEEEK